MKLFLKKIFLSNVQIKLFSLILAYAGWSLINKSHTDDIWTDVPVCFYETEKGMKIACADTVKMNLSGKRSDLRSLNIEDIAIHIDSRTLAQGENTITLSERQVMLPETIKVTGWAPSHLEVETKTE